jgi:ribosome-associated protein
LILARSLVDALESKKAEDVVLLDLRGNCLFADYFVICTGSSDRMIKALVEAAVEAGERTQGVRARSEGRPEGGWVLADFGEVILHAFSPEKREYYELERLWSQAKVVVRIQ